MVLGTVKLKHRNRPISPSMRGRDVAKELTARKNITKEFTIVFFETKNIVNRNSKLAGPSRKCIEMIKLAHEDHSYRLSREEFKRYQGQWYLTLNKSGKNAPMRLRIRLPSCSHSQEPSPSRIRRRTCRTHFSPNNIGDGTLLPQVIPGGTGTRPKAGGAHEFNSFFRLFVAVGFVCSW